MSEPAAEMPISDAREHLADVVNRAAYGGEPTYLTRRGRRIAIVISANHLAAERARVRQQAVAEACEQMWRDAADQPETTRSAIRAVLDRAIALAEDVGDVAAIAAAKDDHDAGIEPVAWEQVKAEIGL